LDVVFLPVLERTGGDFAGGRDKPPWKKLVEEEKKLLITSGTMIEKGKKNCLGAFKEKERPAEGGGEGRILNGRRKGAQTQEKEKLLRSGEKCMQKGGGPEKRSSSL